ncbi:glycosyltransferase family 31 protein [Purpureocillium lavendulum]|uniref:Glycosyltransferase family 31 protein n=1 Tax=Purpureocillium lavendulum TaxID=1247861 RepID=A0AB34G0S0_9HYPO|nr:glycosyltransferase family 31 protein [Purpureocillium lavendulum]
MVLAKGLSGLHVRISNVMIIGLVVVLCVQATRYWQSQHRAAFLVDLKYTNVVGELSAEEEYLERLVDIYGLTNLTKWQAWRVQPSRYAEAEEDGPITDVHVNFDSARSQKIINLQEPCREDLHASKKLALPVRTGEPDESGDASEFLFGISTSYERISAGDWTMVRAWQRWLTKSKKTSNGAGLVLMLDQVTDKQQRTVDDKLHDAGIDAYVMSTDVPMSMARRYYELVRILKTYSATLAASGQRKRWYGVVEDSVFFPSIPYLRSRLARYDSNDQLVIGLPSERADWQEEANDDGGTITTSGGGVLLLTREAVSRIPRLPCLERDAGEDPVRPKRWDEILKKCMKKAAAMDMHIIPSLYSPRDEPTELHVASHETGARPLVLHDYQRRYRIDVAMAHLVTNVCGEPCFMQRYLFHDNWVLVNGVSISEHPDGLELQHKKDHHRKFEDEDEDQDQDQDQEDQEREKGRRPRPRITGQLVIDDKDDVQRVPLTWAGRRNVWALLDSAVASDGAVWQAYLRKGTRGSTPMAEGAEEMDSVIVLIWEHNTA